MAEISNEMVFYTGLGIIGISVVLLVIYFFVMRIREINLKNRLDSEYGAIPNNRKTVKKKAEK